MRRLIGIGLLAGSGMASVALLAMGRLGSEQVVHTASGVTPAGGWHTTVVEFDPNWWAVVPLIVCFLVGLLCLVLPARG